MLRPTSLMRRSDNERMPQFQANANNIKPESLDCGITALKMCNTPACHKLGNKTTMVIILILVGIIQGAVEQYLRISAKQAAVEHNFSTNALEWLLVTNALCEGIIALNIAYYGNRVHRVAWLGGLFMIQAIVTFILILPTLIHSDENVSTIVAPDRSTVCLLNQTSSLESEKPHGVTTLVLFFVAQVFIGLSNVAFYSLGLSYVDDNCREHESPALIGAIVAAKIWGPQAGHGVQLIVGATTLSWWLGWTILAPINFIVGVIFVLFPRRLLKTIVREAANDIIEVATNSSQLSLADDEKKVATTYIASVIRLLKNKILMLNTFAAVFIQIGIVNFYNHEANYLQSRFFLPTSDEDGYYNEWTSRLMTRLVTPPMAALTIVIGGLIIAKANPSARKLTIWNIISSSIVVILFICYIFIDCDGTKLAGTHRTKLNQPYCASSCLCSDYLRFNPVCPMNSVLTYYSPCHAGCSVESYSNGLISYSNCSCGIDMQIVIEDGTATQGACGMFECQKYWIIFQALTVLAAAMLGSGIIGKLIITIRSVLPQDKAIAIALELHIAGTFINGPGKLAYTAIYDSACEYWSSSNDVCLLHENPRFANLLNIVTASFVLAGVLLFIVVFIFVRELELYGNDDDANKQDFSLSSMHRRMSSERQSVHENENDEDVQQSETLLGRAASPISLTISSIQNSQTDYPRSLSPTVAQTLAVANQNGNGNMNFVSTSPTYAQIRRNMEDIIVNDDQNLNFQMQQPKETTFDTMSIPSNSTEVNGSGYFSSMQSPTMQSPTQPQLMNFGDYNSQTPRSSEPSSVMSSPVVITYPKFKLPPPPPTKPTRPMSPETDF